MSLSGHPNIFNYTNYRLFLQDYIQTNYLSKGKSYRAFTKRCGIGSPNYFQQVFNFQRNISHQTAEKICTSLKFPKDALDYFLILVRLEKTKNADTRFMLLGQLQKIASRQSEKLVKDESFHSSWVHQIVWSSAHTKFFQADPLLLHRRFRDGATRDEIEKSIGFLVSKGYFVKDDDPSRFRPLPLRIESDNDVKNLDLQRNHSKFLQMAIRRMNDDLMERELQGLTLSFKKARWPQLKEKLREFIHQMNDSFCDSEDGDAVIRLQMAAFVVAD